MKFQIFRLVSWCALIGITPYIPIQGANCKKSWSKMLWFLWWFTLLAAQMIEISCTVFKTIRTAVNWNHDGVVLAVLIVIQLCYLINVSVSRALLLQWRRLAKAVESVETACTFYEKTSMQFARSRIKVRWYAAVSSILVTVTVYAVVAQDIMRWFAGSFGHDFAVFLFMSRCLGHVQIDTVLMILYVGNSILYQLLRHLLASIRTSVKDRAFQSTEDKAFVKRTEQSNETAELQEALGKSQQVFVHISRAAHSFNAAFSVPLLLLLVSKLISITSHIYKIIFSLHDPIKLSAGFWVMQFTKDLITITIIFCAADLPMQQVKKIREKLLELLACQLTAAEANRVFCFLRQLETENIQLSAAGLFNVGKHLIPGIAGVVTTYVIVLLQSTWSAPKAYTLR